VTQCEFGDAFVEGEEAVKYGDWLHCQEVWESEALLIPKENNIVKARNSLCDTIVSFRTPLVDSSAVVMFIDILMIRWKS
jgi:hypothetical protein